MTNEQKRKIAEETAQVLQKSLKERSIQGLKGFLKDLAHRQTQAVNQTLSRIVAPSSPLISEANQETLKHGYYVLSEEEKKILAFNRGHLGLIWDKLKAYNLSNNHTAREAAGLDPMKQDTFLEKNRVFVVTETGLRASRGLLEEGATIKKEAVDILAVLMLYTQFLTARSINDRLTITSNYRPPEHQAKIMLEGNPSSNYYRPSMEEVYVNPHKRIYKKDTQNIYNKIRIEVTSNTTMSVEEKNKVDKLFTDFVIANPDVSAHSNPEKYALDILPDIGFSSYSKFREAIVHFRKSNIYLDQSSLLWGESNEPVHHIVIKGLRNDI